MLPWVVFSPPAGRVGCLREAAERRQRKSNAISGLHATCVSVLTEERKVTKAKRQRPRTNVACAQRPVRLCTNRHSPVTNHHALTGVSNAPPRLRALIGTPERLESFVTYRKQTIETHSNRYRSRGDSHLLSRWFTLARKAFARANHTPWLPTNRHSPVTPHRSLPETAERVETRVSHRKQTAATPSTRDTLRDTSLRIPSAVPAPNPQLPASRTLARIGAAGVTSVPQRDQWPARTYTCNALGGGCYEST